MSGTAWAESESGGRHFQKQDTERDWFNPERWGVEGRAFADTENFYNRLPARAKGVVREAVWNLSRHSSGMSFRFKSDSPDLSIRYELENKRLAMAHMPATGVSGVDLYARDDEGQWRWVSVLKVANAKVDSMLIRNLIPAKSGLREFMIYLPLYNTVSNLSVGVKSNSKFETVAPRKTSPIVFYGTSIMHGACASRSGMSISAIVGRKLKRPTINLGFSGNGKMEAEVGRYLCELDPCTFAIDCLPNMQGPLVAQRCEPLVKQIRAARPNAPILLVEDRVNSSAWIRRGAEQHHESNRRALEDACQRLTRAGVSNLHYLGHGELLGNDGEATTDGSHPSDLGMVRYAKAYATAITKAIG